MRLAIFDNLANNAYLQAKAFRRRGFEVDLVLDPTDDFVMSDPRWEDLDLALPPDGLERQRLPPWPDEPSWIRRGTPLPPGGRARALAAAAMGVRAPRLALAGLRAGGAYGVYLAGAQRWVVDTLRGYDAVLAYGFGPAYAALAGVPCVAQTWGGDITIVPFGDAPPGERGEERDPAQHAPRPSRSAVATARLQRLGYEHAHRILLTDPRFAPYAARLGHADKSVFLPFLMDTERYAPAEEPALRAELLGSDGRLLLFVPSRLDFHWKGSDLMLRGVAEAMGDRRDVVLACAGWGADRDRADALARELGILDRVRFLPQAFSKLRLLRHYRAADVVLDQFTVGSYGASALEAMSCARPLLIHLDRERFAGAFDEAPSVVNVGTPEEIAAALRRLIDDPAERARAGTEARAWVVAHQGDHRADEAHALLLEAARARPARP